MSDLTETQAAQTVKLASSDEAALADFGIGSSSAQTLRSTLALDQIAKVSSINSTTALLGVSGTFVGAWEDVTYYGGFTITVKSDVASAIDGFKVEWSDSVQTLIRSEVASVTANKLRAFSLAHRGKFFRVTYINGTVAQTSFTIETIHKLVTPGMITKPLKTVVNGDNFAQLMQSAVMVRLANDDYTNISGIKMDGTALFGIADSTAILANLGFGFSVSTDRISTGGTTETPYLLVDNPTGSNKTFRFDKIVLNAPEATGAAVTYRFYRIPTITANGTLLVPSGNRNTNQSASAVNNYLLPTASAFGVFRGFMTLPSGAVPFDYDYESGLIVEPGFKFLITADQTSGTGSGGLNIEYSEVVG